MLTLLLFTKLSAVLTVLYAGMNLHQITSSYAYLTGKIEEFRALLSRADGISGLIRLNAVFYVALPLTYLAMLKLSSVAGWVLAALAVKFAFTAGMDIRAERRIIAGADYTRGQHAISRVDNALNLGAAWGVIYLLFWPSA